MFKMNVNTTNAAFGDDPQAEMTRILREVIDKIERGYDNAGILDVNGNTVGAFQFIPEA